MKSNFESMEEMQKMQQEAVRRVQEMQKRAKQSLAADIEYSKNKAENIENQQKNRNNGETPVQPEDKRLIQNVNSTNKNTNGKQNCGSKNGKKMNLFSSLLNDKEKSLILILILILVDENCDLNLVVALIYLII